MYVYPVINSNLNSNISLSKRCSNPYVNKTKYSPSFSSGVKMKEINDMQLEKALHMLKNKVTEVKVFSDLSGIKEVADTLMIKYYPFGIKSIGAMLIPEEHLAEFLSNNQRLYANIDDYRGVCVAVGDKYGPVEGWTKAYQAIVALVPKSVFG